MTDVNIKKGPIKTSKRRPAMNKGSVLSELDAVEELAKQDTLTSVKEDIKSDVIKDEPERIQVIPSSNGKTEEQPLWLEKLKKEKDERVLKWILQMAPKVNHPDVKDYEIETLKNPSFLFALIRYFEPKAIKEGTKETVENAVDVFKSLNIEGENLKVLIFKAHEHFTSPVYEGIIRQRQIEVFIFFLNLFHRPTFKVLKINQRKV
jgi:hypothetical protein